MVFGAKVSLLVRASAGVDLTNLGHVDPTWFDKLPPALSALRWAGDSMGFAGGIGSVSDVHIETLVKQCPNVQTLTAIGSMISDGGVETLTKAYSSMQDFICPAGMYVHSWSQ